MIHQNLISDILLACGKEKVTIDNPVVLEKLRYQASHPDTKWVLEGNVLYACHAVLRDSPEYREKLKREQLEDRERSTMVKAVELDGYQSLMKIGLSSTVATALCKNPLTVKAMVEAYNSVKK